MSLLKTDKRAWKNEFIAKFLGLIESYPSCLIVNADNISSRQMQNIRINLRGKAVMLMGKNTRIKKALQSQIEQNPSLEKLIPHIKQNIGFVFTKGNLREIKSMLSEHKVKAPAKVGAVAPIDVFISAQQTTMGPEKTSFFQALSISTRITKGAVEILNDVHLIKKNHIVGASEAALLTMLNVMPFEYTLTVKRVYEEGSCYDPFVLEITNEDIVARMRNGIHRIAALSMAINYPTKASASLLLNAAFKDLLAVSIAADVECEQTKEYTELLNDPSRIADLVSSARPAVAESESPVEAASKKPDSDEDSEEEEGGMFDLFG